MLTAFPTLSARRCARFGAITALAALITGSSAVIASAAPSASRTTPQNLVSSALKRANNESSVRYQAFSQSGSQSITVTADAATRSGRQVVAIRNGSHAGTVIALLTGGNAYYRGDRYGLTSYLGMPSSLAPRYVGKWLEFTPSDSNFDQISKSFSVSSAVSEVAITGPYSSKGRSTVNGTAVIGIGGRTTTLSSSGRPGPGTLYVSTGPKSLPVRFTGSGDQAHGRTATGWLQFFTWGQPVTVKAPAHAVKASSISAGGSASGNGSSGNQ